MNINNNININSKKLGLDDRYKFPIKEDYRYEFVKNNKDYAQKKMKEMHDKGISKKQIAKKFNCARITVSCMLDPELAEKRKKDTRKRLREKWKRIKQYMNMTVDDMLDMVENSPEGKTQFERMKKEYKAYKKTKATTRRKRFEMKKEIHKIKFDLKKDKE